MKMQISAGGVVAVVGVVAAIGAFFYLKNKGAAAVNAINPLNNDNVINKAANDFVGEVNLSRYFDRTYATIDLLNPFNESDAYAKQVFGIPQETEWLIPGVVLKPVVPDSVKSVINSVTDWFADINPFNDGPVNNISVVDEDYRNTVNNNKTGY